MDLELSDEQIALQESVRDFLEAQCPISVVRQVVEEGKGAEELWTKVVELDWPAVAVAEGDGGTGLGFVELAVVCEQLGRALFPAPFLATAGQFVSAVREAGDAEQRRRFLGAVARDGIVGSLAVAEAAGSYKISDVSTEAVEDHGRWRLSGTKHFVFDANRADELVVAARLAGTTGADGIALFVVPGSSVSSVQLDSLDPTRQYSIVELDGAVVGTDRVLGEPGGCAPVLGRILEEATTSLSAEAVGTCQAMFDIVHSYVGQREQFGVKIGSFQAVKHKLADMYVALEAARAVTYFAALCIAEDDERRALAVSMAKSSVADCQKLVTQQSIQCLGGIGYTWEHDVHFFVKRAKAQAALFGTGESHRELVGSLIGLRGDQGAEEAK